MASFGTHGSLRRLSPFGGNVEEQGGDLGAKTRQHLEQLGHMPGDPGYDEMFANVMGLAEQTQKPSPAAEAVDQWGDIREGILGIGTQGREQELMGARTAAGRTRQSQIDLLNQMAARRSTVPGRRTATLNQAVEQLAADPRARLDQLRGVAPGLTKATMGHAAQEGIGRDAQVAGGYGRIRGQDLQTAGLERSDLANQLKLQQAKEQLALQAAQQAEAHIGAMEAAELGLADIQAGIPSGGIDFWNQIFPGLVSMGSAGLGALAAGGGQQAQIPGVSPIGVSQPMGVGAGGHSLAFPAGGPPLTGSVTPSNFGQIDPGPAPVPPSAASDWVNRHLRLTY